ncbi:MAG: hypothetical protein EZS28_023569 [Streblomastix strix]|uniref:Uncharacterized protein n=1 Tax=Streblomastix strix TaxID=222440 RepID=A0A5J4VEP3_9EUKA|nr:MAG: hypothetical protein EZS28_023569 [Streblomastix strix]
MPNTSLNTAKLSVNVSDIEEPLKFVISGDKMIPRLYLVMTVELTEKTKEQIDLQIENNIEFHLQSYQQYLRRYWTAPILLPITIADGVIEGYNKLWYQYRDSQLQGRDIYGCGWCDDACRTFEFGLQEVNLGIGGNETELIENKTIMISDDTNGYDQVMSIELNQQERRCQNLRIMKVLFGDELYALTQQADILIFKEGFTTLEDNNEGWIHIQNEMNVSLQVITLLSEERIFIPAICISNQNTNMIKEFLQHNITFLSQIPYSTGPRGVVQIDLAFKDIQILNCQFEKIIIDSLGRSALRIENFTDTPPIIPPLILPLPHPEPDTSINIIINSTSFKDIQSS